MNPSIYPFDYILPVFRCAVPSLYIVTLALYGLHFLGKARRWAGFARPVFTVTLAIHALYLTAELLRILRLLDAHAIRAVPLKGPALAQSLYGDLALREFCDLDVLVQETDLRKARGLLEAQGYHLDLSPRPPRTKPPMSAMSRTTAFCTPPRAS